jgi:hypothetical protein
MHLQRKAASQMTISPMQNGTESGTQHVDISLPSSDKSGATRCTFCMKVILCHANAMSQSDK